MSGDEWRLHPFCKRCSEEFPPEKLNEKSWCVTCELLDRVTNLEVANKRLIDRMDALVGAKNFERRK